jgi:hypothetical protein
MDSRWNGSWNPYGVHGIDPFHMESMEDGPFHMESMDHSIWNPWNPPIPYGIHMEYSGECKVLDETDTAVGRIDILSIPPPYSVASLKRRLRKAEEISDPDPQLFEDEDSKTAMNDASGK